MTASSSNRAARKRAAPASEPSASAEYVSGADRNNPDEVKSHLYCKQVDGSLLPMCDYGWNRADGEAFSILRGHGSAKGSCAICQRRAALSLPPVWEARPHKTRWL